MMSADYDIFISYHGDSHGRNSSYPVADKLKEFFEGHEGKKFKCFLCRRERPDDFYNAINQALLSAKHFILVACDKDGLSDWVADEIKQFDGLRKIGKKPNSIINAYIYGDIQIDDLLDFNPLFSTKDIAYGEDGFAKLYAMVLEKSLQTDRKLSFNFRKDVIEGLVFLCPLTQRFQNKIKGYLAKDSDPAAKEIYRKIADDMIAFEAHVLKNMLAQSPPADCLWIVQTQNPACIADYLITLPDSAGKKMLLFDPSFTTAAIVADGSVIPILSIDDLQFVFKNHIIDVNSKKIFDKNTVAIASEEGNIELPMRYSEEYGNVVYYLRKFGAGQWKETVSQITNIRFCLYVLHALEEYVFKEGTEEHDDVLGEIDFCMIELFGEEYSAKETEKALLEQKKESLIKNESLLERYYDCIKSDTDFGETETKRLFSSRYGEIAFKLREYYSKHSLDMLALILGKLYEVAEEEHAHGFYSRYEALMFLLFKIYIHNIFIVEQNALSDKVYESIQSICRSEYASFVRCKLNALLCAYRKELVFGGKLGEAENYNLAVQNILGEFAACIGEILSYTKELKDNPFKEELLLLYRQRCVIWEQCGDSSVLQEERIAYYKKWKEDCEEAVKVAEMFDCDKEILGCVYLNLASSLNKLAVGDKDSNMAMLNKCLHCLDIALDLLRVSAAERNIGYAYLHKSDCYEAMLALETGGNAEKAEEHADLVKEIRRYSSHAMNIFKTTDDNVAKCWALRLSIKGRILLSNGANRAENIKGGLKSLREAFKYCQASKYVNGMAECVKDFTLYNKIIEQNGLGEALAEEVRLTFFEEMSVFASVIRFLDLEREDIMQMQEQSEKLVSKLVD